MKTKALVFVFLTIAIIQFFVKVVVAEDNSSSDTKSQISSKKLDQKAKILADYLAQYDSPLQYNAQDFIDAANTYSLDWKMVAAISGVESTFGKQIPGGYNGWGWGVYGNQAIFFNSWKEAIYTISKGLKENYIDKGLTEPYSINKVYAASPYWGKRVTYFMNDLDKFASKYETETRDLTVKVPNPKTAAVSGQLALTGSN